MNEPELLLGEWACLGVVVERPVHGYAVAKRLAKDGDLGRVWTMSRPMVYRCLDALADGALVASADGPPDARGRTELRATAAGRRALLSWLDRPVGHLRDVRSELLLKVLLLDCVGRDRAPLLAAQLAMATQRRTELEAELTDGQRLDPVALSRAESAAALERTLRRLAAERGRSL